MVAIATVNFKPDFFLKHLLHENICCEYSEEAPDIGASNEYHNVCFW